MLVNDPLEFNNPINIFLINQNIILSDCNWTRTHNHLVHKRTLKQFC